MCESRPGLRSSKQRGAASAPAKEMKSSCKEKKRGGKSVVPVVTSVVMVKPPTALAAGPFTNPPTSVPAAAAQQQSGVSVQGSPTPHTEDKGCRLPMYPAVATTVSLSLSGSDEEPRRKRDRPATTGLVAEIPESRITPGCGGYQEEAAGSSGPRGGVSSPLQEPTVGRRLGSGHSPQ